MSIVIDSQNITTEDVYTVELNKKEPSSKPYLGVRKATIFALLSLSACGVGIQQGESMNYQTSTVEYQTWNSSLSSTWNSKFMTEAITMKRQHVTENKLNVEKVIGHEYVLSDIEWLDTVEDYGDIQKMNSFDLNNKLMQSPYETKSYIKNVTFLEEGDLV